MLSMFSDCIQGSNFPRNLKRVYNLKGRLSPKSQFFAVISNVIFQFSYSGLATKKYFPCYKSHFNYTLSDIDIKKALLQTCHQCTQDSR